MTQGGGSLAIEREIDVNYPTLLTHRFRGSFLEEEGLVAYTAKSGDELETVSDTRWLTPAHCSRDRESTPATVAATGGKV